MADLFGQAFWPGVNGFISCSYTVSHGTSPGIASLEVPEQNLDQLRLDGTLVITDGQGVVTLTGARVIDVSFNYTSSGRTIVLQIADRRWRWRYGSISGSWNIQDPYPDPDLYPPGEYVFAGGPYAAGTYRPANLLMADCLAAMRETNVLISPAPVIPVPAHWDVANPAQALASLAGHLDYRVVYQPVTDRILVTPLGVGLPLPSNLPIILDHPSVALPPQPNLVQLVGGPTIFHDFVALEPVGEEKDGTIKPINDLSYAPVGGWEKSGVGTFGDVQTTEDFPTREEASIQARRCIWRMFRVKMVDVTDTTKPGPNIGGYGRIYDRKQIQLGSRIYDDTRGINGQPNTTDPFVVGSVYIPAGPFCIPARLPVLEGGNTALGSGVRLPFRFTIDSERGLVIFADYMTQRVNGHAAAPVLFIYTSFGIQSIIGRIPARFERGGTNGAYDLGCPPEVLHHPELVGIIKTVRKDADFSIATVGDNLDDLIPPADYYLNAANNKYQLGAALDRTYCGIIPLDPDGAIQQVTWSVGGGQPATTRASYNCEHATYLPSYPERRRVERTQNILYAIEKAQMPKPPATYQTNEFGTPISPRL